MTTINKKANTYLSKSLFVRGLQCHKSLYLHKYNPELKDEVSEELEAKFQSGKEVGILAQNLFLNGIEIPFDDVTLSTQIKRTMTEIQNGTKVIYEAAFSHNNVFVKCDIFCENEGKWEIYEVKASTKVQNHYIEDIAVQYYVLKGLGLPVSKAFLVHINNQYMRQDEIEVDKLFTIVDLTDIVKDEQDFVVNEIKKMRNMLTGEAPKIDIGVHCSDPYDCDFKGHCWQHIPEDSIFSLGGNRKKIFDMYREGIVILQDIPKNRLSQNQKIHLEGYVEKKKIINNNAIEEFLDSIWYPLYFLDFETTFMVPIPMFNETRPYQQVPFQYSLHYQKSKNAELKHHEYLAPANADPRKEFIKNLLNLIPEDACVLVYNKTFEKKILNYLKEWFPEHTDQIENIIHNLIDLMIPFRQKNIYYPEMEGSYSMKYVLPALVPEMSYDEMEISDGEMASSAWLSMWEMEGDEEIENIRIALLKYCKMDTLGMVRILSKFEEI